MAAIFLVASMAQGAWGANVDEQLHQLRSLRDIPFPKTVEDGLAFHIEVMRRSRRIEKLNGHYRQNIAAKRKARPAAYPLLSDVNANTPISPVDFGADPTGM